MEKKKKIMILKAILEGKVFNCKFGSDQESKFAYYAEQIILNLLNCKDENIDNLTPVNPNQEIAVVWNVVDVKGLPGCSKLSNRKCLKILKDIKRNHDCNYGITWDTLVCFASNHPAYKQDSGSIETIERLEFQQFKIQLTYDKIIQGVIDDG